MFDKLSKNYDIPKVIKMHNGTSNMISRKRYNDNSRPQDCNFIKIETLAQVFSCEFCEISKNTFFAEHVWATASVSSRKNNL